MRWSSSTESSPRSAASAPSPHGRRVSTRSPGSPGSALHVAVQHHPSRAHLLERLLPALDGLEVVIAADPGGRIADPWRSHRLALETLGGLGDESFLPRGVLVIQDDALPVDGFVEKAVELTLERPDEMICLFAPGFRPITLAMLEARRRGQSYATLPYLAFVPVVCIWYPAAIVEDLLGWADRRRCVGADDGIVARYVRERRRLPLVTVPCLVDHDDDVPSVRGGPRIRQGAHRRAALL